MNLFLISLLALYPNGFFGAGPSSASDAGMMLEQGVLAVEYNPAGLAWVDSLEVGVAAEGLFAYNLVAIAYKYLDYPFAASFQKNINTWGFSLGGGYLIRPMATGAGFSAFFDTLRRRQDFSLRAGIQWRDYVGVSLGPRLWTAEDTAHLSALAQIGTAVPIPIPDFEGLEFLAGAAAEIAPACFRAGGGFAYEPWEGLRIQTLVSTEEWGAGLLLDNVDDRGGIWVRKEFPEQGGETPWQFGISYVRNLRSESTREVIVYRNLPGRVDTVYVPQDEAVTRDTSSSVVSSPDVRKKQERLMAKANRYYAAENYEAALEAWRGVVALDSSSDLAVRAKQDIKEVTALIETLQRIRSGRGNKPQ